jgi:hypothetical protein
MSAEDMEGLRVSTNECMLNLPSVAQVDRIPLTTGSFEAAEA